MNYSNKEKNIKIGTMLKTARIKQNVTQRYVAECIGITTNQIACIESGRCKASIDALLGYCDALKMTPNMILGFKDEKCKTCHKLNDILQIIES